MEIKATAKFIRQSPRKVRLVAALIKNLPAGAAQEQLKILPKRAGAIVLKVLNSAIANAENNRQLKKDSLFVSRAFVDQGPTLKRFRARAFGRGAPIRKRTSHLTIILSEKVERKEQKNSKSETLNSKQITNSNVPNKSKIKV